MTTKRKLREQVDELVRRLEVSERSAASYQRALAERRNAPAELTTYTVVLREELRRVNGRVVHIVRDGTLQITGERPQDIVLMAPAGEWSVVLRDNAIVANGDQT